MGAAQRAAQLMPTVCCLDAAMANCIFASSMAIISHTLSSAMLIVIVLVLWWTVLPQHVPAELTADLLAVRCRFRHGDQVVNAAEITPQRVPRLISHGDLAN